jgi:hypothetical protein
MPSRNLSMRFQAEYVRIFQSGRAMNHGNSSDSSVSSREYEAQRQIP